MNEIQLQQKHSCFKGEKLLLKNIRMLLFFFEIVLIAFEYLFRFHNQIMFQKDSMILLSLPLPCLWFFFFMH